MSLFVEPVPTYQGTRANRRGGYLHWVLAEQGKALAFTLSLVVSASCCQLLEREQVWKGTFLAISLHHSSLGAASDAGQFFFFAPCTFVNIGTGGHYHRTPIYFGHQGRCGHSASLCPYSTLSTHTNHVPFILPKTLGPLNSILLLHPLGY